MEIQWSHSSLVQSGEEARAIVSSAISAAGISVYIVNHKKLHLFIFFYVIWI